MILYTWRITGDVKLWQVDKYMWGVRGRGGKCGVKESGGGGGGGEGFRL